MAGLDCKRVHANRFIDWWEPAWAPVQTVLKYTIGSIFVGLLVMLPVGFVFGSGALLVPVLSVIVGGGLGLLVWNRSHEFVKKNHHQTMIDSHRLVRDASASSTIYASPLTPPQHTTPGPAPASYTATLVESTPEWCSITDVTIDITDFSTTEQRVCVLNEKIRSESFENGLFTLVSDQGTWEVSGIAPTKEETHLEVVSPNEI